MGIGDPGGEELIGGKQRLGAGALEHDRDRSGGTRGLGSGQQGSLGRGPVHGDLGNDKNLYRELSAPPPLAEIAAVSSTEGGLPP